MKIPSEGRIVLVRLGALGDVVNTLPALTALRRALPQAYIAWAVESPFAPLLQGHPMLNRVIVVPRRARGGNPVRRLADVVRALGIARRELAEEHFDVAIDLHGNLRSGLATYLSRAPVRIGYARGQCREWNHLFTNWRVSVAAVHRAERHLAVLRGAGVPVEGMPPPVVPEEPAAANRIEGFLSAVRSGDSPVIVVHPGTSQFGAYKQWPVERFATVVRNLCEQMRARVVVTWGPGERAMAEGAAGGVRGATVAPETSLEELAALVRRCDLFIGADSGPLHLASAVGTPVVALFGPKAPARYGPVFSPRRIVEVPLECRPCRKRRCADPRCMHMVLPQMVFDAASELLRETAAGRRRCWASE